MWQLGNVGGYIRSSSKYAWYMHFCNWKKHLTFVIAARGGQSVNGASVSPTTSIILSVSFHMCSVHIHSSITDTMWSQQLTASLNKTLIIVIWMIDFNFYVTGYYSVLNIHDVLDIIWVCACSIYVFLGLCLISQFGLYKLVFKPIRLFFWQLEFYLL
jgi:hypothetical protein